MPPQRKPWLRWYAVVFYIAAGVIIVAGGLWIDAANDTENEADLLVCDTSTRAPSSEELRRYPDRHSGKCYVFSGVVMDVNTFIKGKSDDFIEVWIATGPPRPPVHLQWVLVMGAHSCFRSEGRVLEGDHVTVQARMLGALMEYESVAMGVLEIPWAYCAR